MADQTGQAAVEWTALIALLALILGAALAFVPAVDGRSLGAYLARAIVCAVRGGCSAGDQGAASVDALAGAYGPADAALVRRYAPNIVYEPGTYTLPVDYRRCRSHRCSDAPDRPIEVSRSKRAGVPAAAFTHVVRSGGATFLQYWFYYPDSNTVWGGSRQAYDTVLGAGVAAQAATGKDRYPGFHHDDWEGYQVRIDASGKPRARATAHYGFTYCKEVQCAGEWGPWTGWTRVSKGSHAGHIPVETQWSRGNARRHHGAPFRHVTGYRTQVPGDERTTASSSIELIPLETLPAGDRAAHFDGITPPWRKRVYREPTSGSTS